jgi:hypothetical protein
MATEAPRVIAKGIAQRLSVPPHTGAEKDLQSLFLAENAEEIWNEVKAIVQSVLSLHERGEDTIAQDVFLQLMALLNFEGFSLQNFSDQEIRKLILAHLQNHLPDNS